MNVTDTSRSGAIAVRIDPEDLSVDPGRQALFTIHVVNQSSVVERVVIDVLGSAREWSVIDTPDVPLMPGTDATATVLITPPPGTALGPVPLGVRATAEASGLVEVAEANLDVGASRVVEAALQPRTATGKRRATSVVVLTNLGNAPARVQVVASDPDDAIVFDGRRSVEVGPGTTAELPLRMRLPSREKQGATLPYQVLVEGGDTAQSLDGQVRQPARKRWPIIAAMLVLGLLAAAFLLLKPQDAVAIRDGAADEPTTTIPGATTTAVGGTTVVGAPAGPDPTVAGAVPASPGTTAKSAIVPAVGVPVDPGKQPGLGNVPRPTTTTTLVLPCSPRGGFEATAARVVCAWELGRVGEVSDLTTADAAKEMVGLVPAGGQRVSGPPVAQAGGSRIAFSGCVPGKGVASVVIASAGATAGRVIDVTPCPATTG